MKLHDDIDESEFARKHAAQWLTSGMEVGYRLVLRKLLTQRFGELPADAEAKLKEAVIHTLDEWADRVLTATSLTDVFAGSDTGAVAALERRAGLEALLAFPFGRFARGYFDQGFQQGVGQGVQEGIEVGHRELLRAQLEQRFGTLSARTVAKLDRADTDTLGAWGRRVLTATSLADVFATGSRRRRRRARGVPDFAPPGRATMGLHNYTYQSDFARKYFSEGCQEGFTQGVREGMELGYRELLRDQLQQRFGALPADAGARLEKADSDTLGAWGRRVLTAASLADVFAAEPA